ncbi:uncharacterized protein TRAVEDRAFT_29565 [Trametes versicolor FP-101664 SS1]|uniref:uncharacterized protein n=1 Tax=Trametes versicolor (strain FP-101664) TaxID=717944 RepID=UPI0004622F5F|nr:uncharacterized protein TRAVEDRAFT_29565 [Trametes versicolor FP-101664 SS1]EIW57486.1 hypothetical protein TRAVEDRAFT_29565 [Trametes versicolor FP-101664 SS1]
MSLPEYRSSSAAASQLDIDQSALPGYSRTTMTVWDVPPAEQEHQYHLTDKKTGAQWLTMTVMSRASSASEQPTFYQGANIAGSLKLDLEKEVLVDEVTLALYGRLSIFSHSTSNFFYTSKTLYSAAEQSPSGSPVTSLLKRGRLQGHYDWPYSVRLPKGVSILSAINDGRAERTNYRLPPSFSDKRLNAHVQYTLVVRVTRGGFKGGSKLTVPLNYIPLARPSPPSILRQLAYQEDHPLVGPDGDPDGWKAPEPVKIEGFLFKTVRVRATCDLRISKPLSYTRGGLVHLLCSIRSDNQQFLDLVTPQCINLALVQRITFGEAAQKTRFSERLEAQATIKTIERASASWWRVPAVDEPGVKAFAGELRVPAELAPACQILHYGHEYELIFRGLGAVGFTLVTESKKPLLVEPITIVTAFAQAPRARSYVPPEYATKAEGH